MSNEIKDYPVASLHLDPENPRLPESLQGEDESELLAWFYAHGNLEELAQSLVDNGFFAHEPLIILRGHRKDKDSYVVLEGNRRLAALKIVLEDPTAPDLRFVGIQANNRQKKELSQVPCYLIEKREAVHDFIGFRHIGGLMAWGPEAKARYLTSEIERLATKTDEPFREVGRRVGSNSAGVRNSYIALKLLQTARDEFGIKIDFVYQQRFGVWFRCMNSEELRDYIGFGSPKEFGDIKKALKKINAKNIAAVVDDLTAHDGVRPLVADSRNVTDYGRVLANKKALSTLRKHKRLDLAIQVIRQESLPKRIQDVTESVRIVVDEVGLAEYSKDLADATEDLFRMARSARDIVKGLADSE